MIKVVRRYDCGTDYDCGVMIDSWDGDYVAYEAYAALKAERDALAAENLALKSRCVKVPKKMYLKSMKCNISKWSSFIDALSDCGVAFAHDDGQLVAAKLETPATDAYANQLRAEGAASVGALIRACAYEFPRSAEDIVEECAMIADNRAINLRKENGND